MVWEPGLCTVECVCVCVCVCVCEEEREITPSNRLYVTAAGVLLKTKPAIWLFLPWCHRAAEVSKVLSQLEVFLLLLLLCVCVCFYSIWFLAGSVNAYVPPLSMLPTSFSSVPVCFQRQSGSVEFLQQWLSNQRAILLNHSFRWHIKASYDCLTFSLMTGLIERSQGVQVSLIYWFMQIDLCLFFSVSSLLSDVKMKCT